MSEARYRVEHRHLSCHHRHCLCHPPGHHHRRHRHRHRLRELYRRCQQSRRRHRNVLGLVRTVGCLAWCVII